MMARNFPPHMVSWGGVSMPKRRPSTPKEPSPEDDMPDADDLKKGGLQDSDHETASASSSEPTFGQAPAPTAGVASSFARAGKLFWNPLSGLAALTKQHSRTVTDFSEAEFTTPFAPGTRVWTRYGLGTVETTRADDGFLIVHLQGVSTMTLYLNPADEDYYSVPALRHDWVETPAGEGLVVAFDPKQQSYRVRIGGSAGPRANVEVNVHRSDLRRLMPVRRQHHPHNQQHHQQHPQQHVEPTPAKAPASPTTTPVAAPATTPAQPSVLAKGINSAFKTIVNVPTGLTNSLLSNYYYHGQFVVTTFGQGTIVALDQTSHRAQVQLTWGAMAYLHTDAILYYPKFLVGMDVTTAKFGSGVITAMRPADAMYTVKLDDSDADDKGVYVHESDLVRGRKARPRAGSTSTNKAFTTKLFSLAQTKAKLFGGHSSSSTSADAASPSPNANAVKTPAVAPAAATRSTSARVVDEESDDHVSSAGI